MPFGAHMSIAGGMHNAFAEGEAVGCEAMQVFTKSSNQWKAKELTPDDLARWREAWERKISDLVARLDEADRRSYNLLSTRCRAILDDLHHNGPLATGLDTQSEGLGRLLWMYLRLLLARQAIRRVLREAERGEPIEGRLAALDAQVNAPGAGDDLRRSLNSQADILRQRLAQQTEAKGKLAYLDAELMRIQEQVELIREQAALTTDPELLSQRIDQIAATLGGTAQWIRDQQQVYGAMEDLLSEPPPVGVPIRMRESQ